MTLYFTYDKIVYILYSLNINIPWIIMIGHLVSYFDNGMNLLRLEEVKIKCEEEYFKALGTEINFNEHVPDVEKFMVTI